MFDDLPPKTNQQAHCLFGFSSMVHAQTSHLARAFDQNRCQHLATIHHYIPTNKIVQTVQSVSKKVDLIVMIVDGRSLSGSHISPLLSFDRPFK